MKNKLPFFWNTYRKDKLLYLDYNEICNCNYDINDNLYYTFGYETFGIILYGFSKWLIRSLNSKGINKVLFLSRDGKILKKAFDIFSENEKFDCEYIYVSRRSLRVPLLWTADKKNRKSVICPTKYISIHDLLDSIGLNPDDYNENISKNGLTQEIIIKEDEIDSNTNVKNLLDDIWEDAVSNSLKEYNEVCSYLDQFNIAGKVAIVDIGWRGSMQLFLERIQKNRGIETSITGYYLTLSSSMYRGMDMHGYLQEVDGKGEGCDLLRGYIGLIELMHMCSDGSTLRYKKTNEEQYEAQLLKNEYISNGKIEKELLAIQFLQKGALDFIIDFKERYGDKWNLIPSEMAFYNLNHFANHPTRKALEMFGDFRFFNNGNVTYLAGKELSDYPIYEIKKFKQELYESRWRVGFLKRKLKITLPYYLIFKIMMRIAM